MKITSSINKPLSEPLERGDIVESHITNNVYIVTGVSEANGTFSGLLLFTETDIPLGSYSDALVTDHVHLFEGDLTIKIRS